MSEERPCKQCGLQVIIVEAVDPATKQTRMIALDPRPVAYHVVREKDGPDLAVKAAPQRVLAYHGALCKGKPNGKVQGEGNR